MNIILDDIQREAHKEVIQELTALCPETIARKISKANIQQGFVFDKVRHLSNKESELLCVGSFEDTACEALIKLGYKVTAIDPALNMDLNTFYAKTDKKFDVIFSTSVIEHVKDDEEFIKKICLLLKPRGCAVLTCDFNNDYKDGDGKPPEDYRFYTKNDLLNRLNSILKSNGCILNAPIDYDAKPDFQYAGFTYSFATFCFTKHA